MALLLSLFYATKILEKKRIRFGNPQESRRGFRPESTRQRTGGPFNAKGLGPKPVSDEVKRVIDPKRTHAKGRL
jgi:hypothetical protein